MTPVGNISDAVFNDYFDQLLDFSCVSLQDVSPWAEADHVCGLQGEGSSRAGIISCKNFVFGNAMHAVRTLATFWW